MYSLIPIGLPNIKALARYIVDKVKYGERTDGGIDINCIMMKFRENVLRAPHET